MMNISGQNLMSTEKAVQIVRGKNDEVSDAEIIGWIKGYSNDILVGFIELCTQHNYYRLLTFANLEYLERVLDGRIHDS